MRKIIVSTAVGLALMFAPDDPSLSGQSSNSLLPAHPAREYVRLGGRPVAVDSLPDVSDSAPQVIGVSPSSGAGGRRLFQFTFSDPNGFEDIWHLQLVIHQALTAENSCYISYYNNQIWLAADWGAWMSPVELGAAATTENSQCGVNALTSSVSGAGSTLTLWLDLTFKPAFAGSKSI